MKVDHITQLIGNTPLLRIDPAVHGLRHIDVYAKLEYFNPFGSVKDRIAWAMLKDDIDVIRDEGSTVLESSSGNTAKALQALCSVFGVPFKTVTNRINVQEVRDILSIMGTEIAELPGRSECPDPSDPDNPLAIIDRMLSAEPGVYFHTSQYTNERNIRVHFETTGHEIVRDLGAVDFFVGGLGTTGSTRGTAQYIKEHSPQVRSIGVVAGNGEHVPGIRTEGELFEVGLFQREFYDDMQRVSSREAVDGMLTLIRRCGILAGPTSGATYVGLLHALQPIDLALQERKSAVFIACDRMEWYVSYIRKRRPDLFGLKAADEVVTEHDVHDAPAMSHAEAQRCIAEHNPLIIDMRSNGAYRAGHIPSSMNVPQELLKEMVAGKPFPLTQHVLIVCPVGEQSKHIVARLRKAGYEHSHSLASGITGWRDAGLPLERITSHA